MKSLCRLQLNGCELVRSLSTANQFNFDILKDRAAQSSAVITTPLHLSNKAVKIRAKHLEKLGEWREKYKVDLSRSRLIIDCANNRLLRHYENQKYPPNKLLPLITQHWQNKKYNKSVLVIRNTLTVNPSILRRKTGTNVRNDIKRDFDGHSITSFDDIKLSDEVKSVLCENFRRPTEAQALSMPAICSGKNLILAAETGSGKTLAYIAPLIHKLVRQRARRGLPAPGQPRALIMAPNMELSTQIFNVLEEYSAVTDLKVAKLTRKELISEEFTGQFDVIVATPGLVANLMRNNVISFDALSTVVLDEADTLLDDSFRELILNILSGVKFQLDDSLNAGCQLLLISATFPNDLDAFLAGLPELRSFERITTASLHKLQPQVTHKFIRVLKSTRLEQMLVLAKQEHKEKRSCLIFVNDNKTGSFLHQFLRDTNVPCQFLHRSSASGRLLRGKDDSSATVQAIKDFDCHLNRILIATDLGSRGLDTRSANHVINFNFPRTLAEYLHRAGRLGRAGVNSPSASYLCTSFVADQGDVALVQCIERAVRLYDGRLPDIFDNVKKRFAEQLRMNRSSIDSATAYQSEDIDENE